MERSRERHLGHRVGRRTAVLLVAALVLGLPAAVLRVLCFGRACESPARASSNTPFCSLDEEIRSRIADGFYEGRSPDVLAVTSTERIAGGDGFARARPPVWPSVVAAGQDRVPIVLSGRGVDPQAAIPGGTGLDDVAETIATIARVNRPHATVRSGEAIAGVATGEQPRLILQVAWKGIGSADLESATQRWPALRRLMRDGVGTLDAPVGSLPLDPAAVLTTIGSGGLPREHGITGTVLRAGDASTVDQAGDLPDDEVVEAWSNEAPTSVIATLGDHLDELFDQEPIVALVAEDGADRGLIGGNWYPGADQDEVVVTGGSPHEQARTAIGLLDRQPFGRDRIPDLLAMSMSGSVQELDAALARVVRAAEVASSGSVAVVVTATGAAGRRVGYDAAKLVRQLERSLGGAREVVEATAIGGLYLDQRALAQLELSADVVVRELRRLRSPAGDRLMADVFPSIAVMFGKYC